MSLILALDIGGTQLRLAAFPNNSTTPLRTQRIPTQCPGESAYERLTGLLDSSWPDEPVAAISAACPGPLDPERGIILSTPNIPGWINFPLVEMLSSRYKVPVFLGNDANLAALGEWKYGAGRGHDNVLYLTISTGIGGGVICGGRLLTGAHGMAAELGHLTIQPDGPLCACGQPGHLEAISSGTGIARYVKEQIALGRRSALSGLTQFGAREIAAAASKGDELSLEAFSQAGKWLGLAVANYLHIFNPSVLIFGGGVSQSGDLLFDPMKRTMAQSVMDQGYLDGLEITNAQLGDDAGLLGALAQAQIMLR